MVEQEVSSLNYTDQPVARAGGGGGASGIHQKSSGTRWSWRRNGGGGTGARGNKVHLRNSWSEQQTLVVAVVVLEQPRPNLQMDGGNGGSGIVIIRYKFQ